MSDREIQAPFAGHPGGEQGIEISPASCLPVALANAGRLTPSALLTKIHAGLSAQRRISGNFCAAVESGDRSDKPREIVAEPDRIRLRRPSALSTHAHLYYAAAALAAATMVVGIGAGATLVRLLP